MEKKIVVSLVGMIGAGKTTALNQLSSMGYPVLAEDYIDAPQKIQCDNRLILSKWAWIANWFYKITHYFKENPDAHFVIVDRNVQEAGIWTSACHPLLNPIQLSLKELSDKYRFVNICLHCDYNTIKTRIHDRLKEEPVRNNYNESNISFLDDLYEDYQGNKDLWDHFIDTSCTDAETVCKQIVSHLSVLELHPAIYCGATFEE